MAVAPIDSTPGSNVLGRSTDGSAWIETDNDTALEVTVERLDVVAVNGEELVGDNHVIGVWDLGPDGAEFDEPVRFRVPIDPDELSLIDVEIPAIGVALRHGDGQFEPIPFEVSEDSRGVFVDAEVSGFSQIVVMWVLGLGAVIIPDEIDLLTGQSAELTIRFFGAPGATRFQSQAFYRPRGTFFTVDPTRRGIMANGTRNEVSCANGGEGRIVIDFSAGWTGGIWPLAEIPVTCTAIEPLDVPEGFTVVLATCTGREQETPLDVNALEVAVTGLGGSFENLFLEDCDSHRGATPAQDLVAEDADLYLVGLSTLRFLLGDFGGERDTVGNVYPEPLDDLSRIFMPFSTDAPAGISNRELTAFETFLVLDQALRNRYGPNDDASSVQWDQIGIGLNPDERTGFEQEVINLWKRRP